MAKFGKQGRRCDTCGKFSRNKLGEYVRKDGSAGYVWPEDNAIEDGDPKRDICDDCVDARTTKTFYVLGQSRQTGVLIRCADKLELGLMRYSDCYRIARTRRPATEVEMLAWFTNGVEVTRRSSRFN